VQSDSVEVIARNGNGYVLTDGGNAAGMQSTMVNGTSIEFASRTATDSLTVDLQASGTRMNGTLHGTSSDDNYAASLSCGR
jgi:hypothetical protein